MRIITHPTNKHLIEELEVSTQFRSIEEAEDFMLGIHRINNTIDIVYDEHIEAEEWTGRWLTLQNQFFTYWDGASEPPSWAIYFGFVKKEMRPKFVMVDESKLWNMKFWSPLEVFNKVLSGSRIRLEC